MTVLPFSQALRERTWSGHGESEGAGFMSDLMTGKGTRDDYIALVAQHYFVYEALEAAGAAFADDAGRRAVPQRPAHPAARPRGRPGLPARRRAGGMRSRLCATTERYVRRIHEIVATAGPADSSPTTTRATSATCRAGR